MPELMYEPTGVNLETWLRRNKAKITKKRILYVVSANLDNPDADVHGARILKFGEGGHGTTSKTSGYKRLLDYQYMYGPNLPNRNPCSGAKLYYIYTTTNRGRVFATKTKIHKAEKRLKNLVKGTDAVAKDRGEERVVSTVPNLVKLIRDMLPREHDERIPNPHRTRSGESVARRTRSSTRHRRGV